MVLMHAGGVSSFFFFANFGQFMVANDLNAAQVQEKAKTLGFPQSVVSFFLTEHRHPLPCSMIGGPPRGSLWMTTVNVYSSYGALRSV